MPLMLKARKAALILAAALFAQGLNVTPATAFTWPWETSPDGEEPAATGREGKCGATDLVIVIDRTYSLNVAIAEMKREVERLLRLTAYVSSGDFRVGLIVFRDSIEVRQDFTQTGMAPSDVIAKTRGALRKVIARGGDGGPEASDEAMRTAILGLGPGPDRPQEGRFSGEWRARSKIAVLITDNLPGGFDDEFVEGVDDVHAREVAGLAQDRGIAISAIYVPVDGFTYAPDPRAEEIMRSYAQLSGGLFAKTQTSGRGVAEAIARIIDTCGTNQMS